MKVLVSLMRRCALIMAMSATARAEETTRIIPNENGAVMVLMYHNIGERESTWTRTPENFKKDLDILHRNGFYPVSLSDFVKNEMDVPCGKTPVVISFDDGKLNQFRILEIDGAPVPDPRSAVGALMEFSRENTDFPAEATFFLDRKVPFRQREWLEYKLNYLIEHGMDIGNHTTGHQNLSHSAHQSPEKIQKIIGKQAVYLKGHLRDTGYEVNTLALCFGQRPRLPALRRFLVRGVYDGVEYENIAVLNVGAGPSPSPVDRDFDQFSIPRIRASETRTGKVGLYDWLDHFERHPDERYISDGDANTVTVRKVDARRVARERLGHKTVIIIEK